MEVKPGYKQTEIGVIPEDWEVLSLNDACIKIQDGTHFSPKIGGSQYKYITSKNIGKGSLSLNNVDMISEEEHRKIYKRCDVKMGDVLLTKDGINTGNAAINHLNEEFSLLSSVAILRIDTKYHNNLYLMYQLLSNQGQARITNMISGNAITRLTLEKIRKLSFPFPSTKHEQKLIDEKISSIDSLITSLEKLIEKKKLIKKGVMQELLTGKGRLPGFSGEWETKRLGDLCSHITTGRKDVNEGNPNGMYPFFTCSRAITYSDHFSFDTEAILIAGNGDVGTLHYFTGKFEAYQRTYVLTGFSVKARYLVHYLNMYLVPTLCDSKIGTSIPYIKIGDLINMPVIVPMDDAEVKHVISVIDDIELEIDMHVVQLKKHELLKQAMMQELLTGRIRLV